MDSEFITLAFESNAITIHDHIKDLQANSTQESYRRWVWELLQNAIDLSPINHSSAVLFKIKENQVEFFHNGEPFDRRSLHHLFLKKTSKREKQAGDRRIGNFGTGFLTTHLLSKVIYISGIFNQGKGTYTHFENFVLDRDGDHKQITQNLMDYYTRSNELLSDIEHSVQFNPLSIQNTVFLYPIQQPHQQMAVSRGLQDLITSIRYSLIFIGHLKPLNHVQIDIDQRENNASYRFDYQFKELFGLKLYENLEAPKGVKEKQISIFEFHNERISLCFPVTAKLGKKPKIKILSRPLDLANLFIVFPLIGTEQLNFPFIINCYEFLPTKERNGIILYGPDTERVNTNKSLIKEAFELSKHVLTQICESMQNPKVKWSNLHLLAGISMPQNRQEYIDLEWYKADILVPYQEFIFNLPIVKTDDGFKPLSKCRIPFHKNLEKSIEFSRVCKRIYRDDIPMEKYLSEWIEVYKKEEGTWPMEITLTLEILTRDISILGFSNFMFQFNNNTQKGYDFLNCLIRMIEEDQPELLRNYAIFPCQAQIFVKASELYLDHQIPEVYKDAICKIIPGCDYRSILLDSKILSTKVERRKTVEDMETDIQEFLLNAELNNDIDPYRAMAYLCIENTQAPPQMIARQRIFSLAQQIYDVQLLKWDGQNCFKNMQLQQLIIEKVLNIICQLIDNVKEIRYLSIFYNLTTQEEKAQLLFDIIQYACDNQFRGLTQPFAIVPTQQGLLIKLDEAIVNQDIQPELLDLYQSLYYRLKQINWVSASLYEDFSPKLISDKLKLILTRYDTVNVLVKVFNLCDLVHKKIFDQRIQNEQLKMIYSLDQNEQVLKLLYSLLLLIDSQELLRSLGVQNYFHIITSKYIIMADIINLWKDYHPPLLVQPSISIKNMNQYFNPSNIECVVNIFAILMVFKFSYINQYSEIMIQHINTILHYNQYYPNLAILLSYSPIIPNQLGQKKTQFQLRLDYDDVKNEFGIPEQLKRVHDYITGFESMYAQSNLFQDLADHRITCEQVITNKCLASELIKKVDQHFHSLRAKLPKNKVIEIFNHLEGLTSENRNYEKFTPFFSNSKAVIYIELFSNLEERSKVLKILSGNQLNQSSFIHDTLLSKSISPNLILYRYHRTNLLLAYQEAGIQVKEILPDYPAIMPEDGPLILIMFDQSDDHMMYTSNMHHYGTADIHLIDAKAMLAEQYGSVQSLIDNSLFLLNQDSNYFEDVQSRQPLHMAIKWSDFTGQADKNPEEQILEQHQDQVEEPK